MSWMLYRAEEGRGFVSRRIAYMVKALYAFRDGAVFTQEWGKFARILTKEQVEN